MSAETWPEYYSYIRLSWELVQTTKIGPCDGQGPDITHSVSCHLYQTIFGLPWFYCIDHFFESPNKLRYFEKLIFNKVLWRLFNKKILTATLFFGQKVPKYSVTVKNGIQINMPLNNSTYNLDFIFFFYCNFLSMTCIVPSHICESTQLFLTCIFYIG